MMDVKYEKKEALTFIGFHKTINQEEDYKECPAFWHKAYSERFSHLFQTQ